MDTGAGCFWHGGHIDDKVPDLAVEVVGVGVPVGSLVIVRI